MTVRFHQSELTVTPAMAKRLGAGPWAGGLMAQGAWDGTGTPDVVTYSRGSQIVSNWHANFDPYQGTIVFLITPEWDGDDGKTHYICADASLRIRKRSDSELEFYLAGSAGYLLERVDVSGWVARTDYCVIMRWDPINTIDGPNHVCISVDDVHSFDDASGSTSQEPSGTLYVGSFNTSVNPANAIISGLHIYRRVLFDGTYGTDVGNGDELALIYNGGDFADPSEVVKGSWDCVFAAPTNATVEELVTGPGEAYTHPHGDNLIPGNSGLGGWMSDGTYTNDGWGDEGTPSAVAATAAADRIFAVGGYDVTSDAVNEGLYQDVVVVAGDDWVIRVFAHSDGTSVPKAILYDQDNGAEIGSVTGSTASTKAAPDVFIFAGQAPAGCTTLRVKLINTAASGVTYWHQVELLSTLWDDPSFEAGTAVTDVGTPTTSAQDAGQDHSGGNSWKIVADAADEGFKRTITTTTGKFYHASAWVYADTAGTVDMEGPTQQTGSTARATTTGNDAWEHLAFVFRATAASTDLQFTSNAAQTFYVDDVAVSGQDDISLTVTPASEANSAESGGLRVDGRDEASQDVTGALAAQAGKILFRVRLRHAPANLVAFLETTNVYLFRISNGANYIEVRSATANTLTLAFNDGGGEHTDDWDCTGAWAADNLLSLVVEYNASVMTLRSGVDGPILATITTAIDFGATVPDTAYWGSNSSGARQIDAVFDEPVSPHPVIGSTFIRGA